MSLLFHAVWAVSNLCKSSRDKFFYRLDSLIDPLIDLLKNDTLGKLFSKILWALANFTARDNDRSELVIKTGVTSRLMDRIELVIKTGVTSRLMEFLKSNTEVAMMVPIMRILGHFASAGQIQVVLDAGLLGLLPRILGNTDFNVREESCRFASHVAAGTENQISALIETDCVLAVLVQQATEGRWEAKLAAVSALSNICKFGSPAQMQKLIQAEGLQPMVRILGVEAARSETLCATLYALECVLRTGEAKGIRYGDLIQEYNGLDCIESLRFNHDCKDVQEAAELLLAHFTDESEDDENLAPQMNGTGYEFGLSSGLSSPKQLFLTDFLSHSTSGGTLNGSRTEQY
jgi:hypothetical protein